MTATATPFSHPIEVHRVPPGGLEMTLTANAAEREGLAALLGLLAVRSLAAELTLKPWRKAGLRVTGTVTAEVEQACVVTLEPVLQTIEEQIEVSFLPESEIETPGREVDIDPDDDTPEPFSGNAVDLGALVSEYLSLGIDPYPRKPGVAFEPAADDVPEGDGSAESPFAALAGLAGRQGNTPDEE